MTTIQLHIPDDLAAIVRILTRNAENYIINLLRAKVKDMDSPKSLEEEYRMAAKENTELMKDFIHVDMEGWGDEY